MIEVILRNNSDDEFRRAFSKWKKLCDNDGFCQELRKRRFYKKPSEKRREEENKRKYNLQQLKQENR